MFEAIIRNPAKAHESKKAVMDGIVHSAMLTATQRSDIDGIIKSSVPEHRKSHKPELVAPVGELAKPSHTGKHIGSVRIPGGRY